MIGAAEHLAHLEEGALVDHGVDDRPHLVDLAAVARDDGEQRLLAPVGRIDALAPRGHAVDRGGQVGQEAARALERLLLRLHRVIDGAGPALHLPAAELLLVERLADARDHRRSRHEHGGGRFRHDRVVAGRQPRRAEARHRAQPQGDDGHGAEVVGEILVAELGDAELARQIGAPRRLDGLDRAAAARAFDDADDGQPQLVGHALGQDRLHRRWSRRPSRRAP